MLTSSLSDLHNDSYLETDGVGQTIKPWFWIALLFVGRVAKSLCDQWFVYFAVRT